MAASDILNLNNSMAPKAIKWLYWIALVIIAGGLVMGLVRGVGIMQRGMSLPPAVTTTATPDGAGGMTTPQNDAQNQRGERRRFYSRREQREFNQRRRNPTMFGVMLIGRTLVRTIISLLLVRVLAEMGLSVLAMGKRA